MEKGLREEENDKTQRMREEGNMRLKKQD